MANAKLPVQRKFTFSRSRGVVWVCDIAGSSKHLNSPESVESLEVFLPRLYYTSAVMVEAAGGEFIKWTGDGFLAWFETPLHRELGRVVTDVLEAAFHLTVFVNVTQLGTSPKAKFKLRHGFSYEQDALLTKIEGDGHTSLDLIGRDVVAAFRLSGIQAEFPGFAAQAEIVNAYRKHRPGHINFRPWQGARDDLLKVFKGERRGTRSVFVTTEKKQKKISPKSAAKGLKRAIDAAEGRRPTKYPSEHILNRFDPVFLSGEPWCVEIWTEYGKFIKENLLGPLKTIVSALEEAPPVSSSTEN